MNHTVLFKTSAGEPVTAADVTRALEDVVPPRTETLFLHTGMHFGTPQVKRGVLLERLHNAVSGLGISTLCVPTFTFSFCNGQEYDPANSRSRMGALNEYMRQLPDAVRSKDPLMSVAVLGKDTALATEIGHRSIGENSFYHNLSLRGHVTFLFLGARLGECFTYMHFLEERVNVPYRYNRDFTGYIVDGGRRYEDTYTLFVRYNGVTPNTRSLEYQAELERRGDLRVRPLGDSQVMAVDKDAATPVYYSFLTADPNFYITRPFDPSAADDTFVVDGEMVAL